MTEPAKKLSFFEEAWNLFRRDNDPNAPPWNELTDRQKFELINIAVTAIPELKNWARHLH